MGMLELGMCFYQGKLIHIEESIKLIKEERDGHGKDR
jgi:hypothetical protein